MGWQRKAKELFFNHFAPTPKEIFHLLTITVLGLLLPLSFLLLATLSGAQYYLQTLTGFQFQFPYLFTFALHINPCILYLLVSIVSVSTLIHGLMGKIILFSDSSNSTPVLQPRLYTAWVLLCAFQVCVGLGIEGSIAAGVFDSDIDDDVSSGFGGVERSFLGRVFFLLGLHETTQVWCRVVVKPVVDDTVFGVGKRRERWIERVAVAASLGTLWWWRLREEVETLAVVAEAKKEQSLDVGIGDFVGWWLYYLTVTIGMVRVVKGLIWVIMVSLCRRRVVTGITSPVESESDSITQNNDDKV